MLEDTIENNSNNNGETMKTISGFKVVKREFDKKLYLKHICNKEDKFISELLAVRGIDVEKKNDFLDPKLKNILPKLKELKDIKNAVKRVIEAINKNEKICIFGDYDVDGITSTSMMILFFRKLGMNIDYYIPDRVKDGYGPNCNTFDEIFKKGTNLIICVDCGTTAFEPIVLAKKQNVDVIVIDHHKSQENLPECISCINPNRIDEKELDDNLYCLCACGVCFLFLMLLNVELKKQNFYKKEKLQKTENIKNKNEIDLISFTPLVAFATICDVMKLSFLNRAFIKTGIKVLNKLNIVEQDPFNLKLLYLLNKEGKNQQTSYFNEKTKTLNFIIKPYDFGFILGPIINAGGRIDNSSLGVKLLTSNNKNEAINLSKQLIVLNEERKELENSTLLSIKKEKDNLEKQIEENGFVLLHSKEFNEGIIGLISSRIKDGYYYPVIIGSETNDNIIKFSCRSVNSVDIGEIVLKAKNNGLLLNGGGHKLAAGFACKKEKINDLISFLRNEIKIKADENFYSKKKEYDLAISLSGINLNLIKKIENFEPYGIGNPKPLFLLQNTKISFINVIKEKHLLMTLSDENYSTKSFCFNCVGTPLGEFLISSNKKIVSLLASATIDEYNSTQYINIKIEDAVIDK